METIIYIFVAGMMISITYFVIRAIYLSIVWGWRQSQLLEQQFGTDVAGAFKYQFGLARGDQPDVDG